MLSVGVISDTHGLVCPEALEALRGTAHILHAGDVGNAEVLEALRALAPVTAVRGNNDRGPWAEALPHDTVVEFEGRFRIEGRRIRAEIIPLSGSPSG